MATGDRATERISGLDSMRVARVCEHSFLTGPIGPRSTVVDLGLNKGEFARAIVEGFGCRVVGVEPVPTLFESLPQLEGLTAEHFAVSDRDEPVTLYLAESSLAASIAPSMAEADASTVQVDGITLSEILRRHELDQVALVKVDIEGAEIPMFDTIPVDVLRRVDQFTVEFHDFIYPDQVEAVKRVSRRLESAGFSRMAFSTDNSDVLFVNNARLRFGVVQRTAAAALYKYPRGLRRRLMGREYDAKV